MTTNKSTESLPFQCSWISQPTLRNTITRVRLLLTRGRLRVRHTCAKTLSYPKNPALPHHCSTAEWWGFYTCSWHNRGALLLVGVEMRLCCSDTFLNTVFRVCSLSLKRRRYYRLKCRNKITSSQLSRFRKCFPAPVFPSSLLQKTAFCWNPFRQSQWHSMTFCSLSFKNSHRNACRVTKDEIIQTKT